MLASQKPTSAQHFPLNMRTAITLFTGRYSLFAMHWNKTTLHYLEDIKSSSNQNHDLAISRSVMWSVNNPHLRSPVKPCMNVGLLTEYNWSLLTEYNWLTFILYFKSAGVSVKKQLKSKSWFSYIKISNVICKQSPSVRAHPFKFTCLVGGAKWLIGSCLETGSKNSNRVSPLSTSWTH